MLRARLARLHLERGQPSTRELARRTGSISHATVHAVLRCAKLPRWGPLELVVEALGADPAEFLRLWITAREHEMNASAPARRTAAPGPRRPEEPPPAGPAPPYRILGAGRRDAGHARRDGEGVRRARAAGRAPANGVPPGLRLRVQAHFMLRALGRDLARARELAAALAGHGVHAGALAAIESLTTLYAAAEDLIGGLIIDRTHATTLHRSPTDLPGQAAARAGELVATLRQAAASVQSAQRELSHALGLAYSLADYPDHYVAAGLGESRPLVQSIDRARAEVREITRAMDRAHVLAAELARDLAAAPLDVSGADLSRLEPPDPAILAEIVWDEKTTWPPALAPRIRAASAEIAPGTYRVTVTPPPAAAP
ncbi:hypothetical protein D5H75_00605 [Bailinhaonella thermotolerans]|uniref:HTH cro/C1-type domain-containing protein n=1 Tax=Bailinhaonella thermotolerans TaxID=1070861 RepID=A0A3A4AXH7_9ACTN|nr:hypothetical protein D5H75_00605 [Bailinhaonella thermotolerans]